MDVVCLSHCYNKAKGLWWTGSIVHDGAYKVVIEWGEGGASTKEIGKPIDLAVAYGALATGRESRERNGYTETFRAEISTRESAEGRGVRRTLVPKNHISITTPFERRGETLTETELEGRDWWQVKVEPRGKVFGFSMTPVGPAVDLRTGTAEAIASSMTRASEALKGFGEEAARASKTAERLAKEAVRLSEELARQKAAERENLSEREKLLPDFDDWKSRLREL